MNTLVIGGAGFIGSHLVDYLVTHGNSVTVLDISESLIKGNLARYNSDKNLKVITGSILDKSLITKLMSESTHCYQLAAALGVERINDDPIGSLEVNLQGCEIVLMQHQVRVLEPCLPLVQRFTGKTQRCH